MIKIEITDPQRENPDVLVKLASFLMDCAGHTMVKAPPDAISAKEIENSLFQQCAREYLSGEPPLGDVDVSKSIDLSKCTGMGILKPKPQSFEVQGVEQRYKPCIETYENPPYKHCSESDLTHYTKCEETGLTEISEEGLTDALGKCIEMVKDSNKEMKEILDNEKAKKDIVSEKPKSATKRKRTPSKVEVISETGVTEVTEDFIPPAPVFAPPPPVNGNTLVDKIVKAKAENKATHEEITEIVKNHGLIAIKDIFTNDHLIPLVNSDLDELLRGR